MRKIGILGGTFDPPHLGHLLIANEVLNSLNLEEIWFMPNREPPHKKKSGFLSDAERVKLLELAIADHPCFRLETIELERPGPSYTYDTILLLKRRHPDADFYFIIGADMIEYLPKWHKISELVHLIKFVGVGRPEYATESPYPIIYVDVPEFAVSSSMIRERVREGKTIRYLVPESVRKYIEGKKALWNEMRH